MFHRLIDFVLCGLSYMTCLVYLDDIIIFGRSFNEQLARLREVFSRIRSANVKLKSSMSSLSTERFFPRTRCIRARHLDAIGEGPSNTGLAAVRDVDGATTVPWNMRLLSPIRERLLYDSSTFVRSHKEGSQV